MARSEIADFFRGRSVLVTGASGFMGKVLLEKLLFGCPDLRVIYILVRSKRYKSAETRTEEMLKIPLFDRLRNERPDALQKILPVQGDITQEELGLTPDNKARIQEEVSVVFHCAATLRLEARLKDAVEMNTAGTWRLLQLARGMRSLKAFVHLSTAFCHCDLQELEERTYAAPVDPRDVMRVVQWMDETSLDTITPSLIQPHPNTYTYTKRLAEQLVSSQFPDLPVVIARPSIVTPAWKEPLPGWVDNLNGPIGLLVGGGKGVIRSMHCRGEYHAEVVPVDLAINALVAIAWRTGAFDTRPQQIPVYNITASAMKRITWAEVLQKGRRIVYENPFEMTIWYPDGNMRSSKLMHNLCVVFLHFLPAYVIDFLLMLFRQKRFMVRLQHKVQAGLEVLQYFTTRQWQFRSDNFCSLQKQLSPSDRAMFYTDFEAVQDEEYLYHTVLGARQYCLKEPLSSLPRCRRNLKILYVVDRLWSVAFYLLLVWLVISYSDTARHLLDVSTDCLKSLPMVRAFSEK
ncbi:putative fatty acyl-CoA reductase CG5065 [Periplaneta americana]|uniref:putative fatty acyl-CoA reductase CG5065 n=1 Tax=Periplaneta americana TaxID=6978 RepID=UPI0037E9B127